MSYEALLKAFEQDFFPALSTLSPDMALRFKTDIDLLARALKEADETHVCFLGQSNVGKSTLINALATGSKTVVPSGGDGGPLTALATEVRYGERPSFVVEYHSADKLNGIRFALESQIARRKAMIEARERPQTAAPQDTALTPTPEVDAPASPEGDAGVGDYEKLARLLILGKQSKTAELSYLADCVRLAIGSETLGTVPPHPQDEVRIKRIRAVFDTYVRQGKKYERHASSTDYDAVFNADLHEHTAGCLAPLIKRIEVCWPSEILKDGLVLVDLPGTGIASDEYRKATEEYVQSKARAVLAVVDKSGFTRDTVDLLRDCRYLARLLGSTEDRTADPCQLLIAVTKVDELFDEEWAREISLPNEQRRRKLDIYKSKTVQLVENIKAQASQQLAENFLDRSRNQSLQEGYKSNYEHLVSELTVYPVFAPDLRRLLVNDEDDRPKLIAEPEQSGIPQLQQFLVHLAREQREKREERICGTAQRLRNAIDEHIRQSEARSYRVTEETVRLRDNLDQFVKPLL
jgi:GTP-binding protein EngB required for normal cell division